MHLCDEQQSSVCGLSPFKNCQIFSDNAKQLFFDVAIDLYFDLMDPHCEHVPCYRGLLVSALRISMPCLTDLDRALAIDRATSSRCSAKSSCLILWSKPQYHLQTSGQVPYKGWCQRQAAENSFATNAGWRMGFHPTTVCDQDDEQYGEMVPGCCGFIWFFHTLLTFLFVKLLNIQCVLFRWHSGPVDSAVASQQEGPRFKLLSLWSLHVLPMSVWVSHTIKNMSGTLVSAIACDKVPF